MTTGCDITLVLMTRNRVDEVLETVDRLQQLPERPAVIVVDNGSTDDTSTLVGGRGPYRDVARLYAEVARQPAQSTSGNRFATYIAFNDDDSWWAPGALAQVVELFDRHPDLGAITANVVVEPGGTEETSCRTCSSVVAPPRTESGHPDGAPVSDVTWDRPPGVKSALGGPLAHRRA